MGILSNARKLLLIVFLVMVIVLIYKSGVLEADTMEVIAEKYTIWAIVLFLAIVGLDLVTKRLR